MFLYNFLSLALFDPEQTGHKEEGAGFILEHVQDYVIFEIPPILGIDISITFHVVMMWIASIFLILLFSLSKRQMGMVPRGMGNVL